MCLSSTSRNIRPHVNTANRQSTSLAYLRLIRVWNLPTAIADVYAGFVLASLVPVAAGPATAGVAAAVRLPLALVVSALIYSAGMAWNDILDLGRDRALHADRPLPSGAVRKGTAMLAASLMMVLGLLLAGRLGTRCFMLAVVLTALTFAYNARLKHKGFTGCANMGACRFFNMWLGIAAGGGALAGLWLFPATLGLYVCAVTLVSLQEEAHSTRKEFLAVASLAVASLLPLAIFCVRGSGGFLSPAALVPLSVLAAWIMLAAASAARVVDGRSIGSLVRTCLRGIILLDSSMLMAAGKRTEGLLCLLLIVPSLMLARSVVRRPGAQASAISGVGSAPGSLPDSASENVPPASPSA